MMVVKGLLKNMKLIISVAVVIGAFLYREELKFYYDRYYVNDIKEDKPKIFTATKLAQFDGVTQRKLYLAVLGTVFDVTEGKRHYKKGGAYNYFIGKDGSRSLVTGNFKDESNEKDHVLDLSYTFNTKYTEVGVLTGRYYDTNGQETAYIKEFYNKVKQCEVEKENSKIEDQKYPPCNIAWNADEGTKVWCSTSSGGIKRSWAGVPRQLFTPGVEKPRCVCLNRADQDSVGLMKEYENCPKSSVECIVKT